ncbi:hypothetical protein Esti_005259 [Eimeria stiedai]
MAPCRCPTPDSVHCCKWEAVYSDAEFRDDSIAIRLCTAIQLRPCRPATEDYCNYVSTVQKLLDGLQPQDLPLAIVRVLQDFPTFKKSQQPSLPHEITNAQSCFTPMLTRYIRMAEEDRFKTSFSSLVGLFEWTVMPMGLISAPASFQRVMSDLFKDLRFVYVYMDDIVIHSATAAMHHEHFCQVSQRLQDNEFRLTLSKCSFQASSIDFLGFEIPAAGIQPLTANISSIMSLPSRLSPRTAVR